MKTPRLINNVPGTIRYRGRVYHRVAAVARTLIATDPPNSTQPTLPVVWNVSTGTCSISSSPTASWDTHTHAYYDEGGTTWLYGPNSRNGVNQGPTAEFFRRVKSGEIRAKLTIEGVELQQKLGSNKDLIAKVIVEFKSKRRRMGCVSATAWFCKRVPGFRPLRLTRKLKNGDVYQHVVATDGKQIVDLAAYADKPRDEQKLGGWFGCGESKLKLPPAVQQLLTLIEREIDQLKHYILARQPTEFQSATRTIKSRLDKLQANAWDLMTS